MGKLLDLTVVVNCHKEGYLLRPTLRSVTKSIDFASNRGISSKLLIVADNPCEQTLLEAQKWTFSTLHCFPIELQVISEGNPGAARNKALEFADSKYFAFCDGDDLVSENYLFESLTTLEMLPPKTIAHPEFVISFGQRSGVWHISPKNKNFSYRNLITENLWCSSSISRKSTYQSIPYRELTGETGYGPEDWLWNIETVSNGYSHISIEDTCFFYRTRSSGGVNNTHAKSVLPPIDIKQLESAMPYSPSVVSVNKEQVRKQVTQIYSKSKKKLGWLRSNFPRLSNILFRFGRSLYSTFLRIDKSDLASSAALGEISKNLYSDTIMKEVQKATWIEPAISWPAYSLKNLPVHTGIVPSYAEILENLLNDMGSDPSLIVAVPWVGIGGADLASINYAQALKEIYGRTGKRIMILSTGIPEKTKRELIPSGIKFVQIDSRFQQLSEELKSRLIAQAFTITKPEVVIAVNCFDLLNSLRSFGKQISENTRIYSTFFSFDRIGNNYPTQPITDGSRDFLDYVTGIFTDNKKIAELLSDILGRDEGYFQVHYQPAFGNNQKLEQELIGQQPSKGSAIRLLWPHRLDKEKKPEVLIEIMKSARQKGVNLEIDVYGEAVLNSHSKDLLKSFKTYGITYQGPYQGGLVALPVEEYDALLLTSESEGMPIVVLQAMSLGLPVIATNVGGLSEVIQEGQTGFLVNGPEDITGFINAIIELQEVEFRNLVAQQAKTKVLEQHSWKSFVDSVSRIVQ